MSIMNAIANKQNKKDQSYLDWALKVTEKNPNLNGAVFPDTPIAHNDYNYRMAYLQDPNGEASANGHLSDIGKKPNHPTFSNESVYAIGRNDAGNWIEPLHGEDWRYNNLSRGMLFAKEDEAYGQPSQGRKISAQLYTALNRGSQK